MSLTLGKITVFQISLKFESLSKRSAVNFPKQQDKLFHCFIVNINRKIEHLLKFYF